jgi:hypothetical protein
MGHIHMLAAGDKDVKEMAREAEMDLRVRVWYVADMRKVLRVAPQTPCTGTFLVQVLGDVVHTYIVTRDFYTIPTGRVYRPPDSL